MPSDGTILEFLGVIVAGLLVGKLWSERHRLLSSLASIGALGIAPFLRGTVLVVVVAQIAYWLAIRGPAIFQFGWLAWLTGESMNLVFAPLAALPTPSDNLSGTGNAGAIVPLLLLGAFYLLLVALMPLVVAEEERMFRAGYTRLVPMVGQSLRFGAVHMLIGIPVGAALALAVLGGYLALRYRRAYQQAQQLAHSPERATSMGVRAAAADHLAFNLIVITLAFGLTGAALLAGDDPPGSQT